jgi:hypothetical protein
MCGKTIADDHQEETDWRSIFYNGIKFHACPDEFSPDPRENINKMILVMRRCRDLGNRVSTNNEK